MALQLPSLPATLQAWQVVVQLLVVQQTPSTQLPLMHSLPPPQAMPGPFFGPQVPPEQKSPPMQSVSALQLFLQAVAPHT
jgi:hypothetical protein